MIWFADLSPYSYLRGHFEDLSRDLNVGWLSPEHPFPTAPPSTQLVNALLRCCLRPEHLCAGIHECEFDCLDAPPHDMITVDYHGHPARLGNGEVRAKGLDGAVYTAPTLVAHYVAKHEYSPPDVFVEAVIRKAHGILVYSVERHELLRAMDRTERFALCKEALDALLDQMPASPLVELTRAWRVTATTARPPSSLGAEREAFSRLREVLEAHDRGEPFVGAIEHIRMLDRITREPPRDQPYAELQRWHSVAVLERLHEAGLVQWRSEWTPSRWDGAT